VVVSAAGRKSTTKCNGHATTGFVPPPRPMYPEGYVIVTSAARLNTSIRQTCVQNLARNSRRRQSTGVRLTGTAEEKASAASQTKFLNLFQRRGIRTEHDDYKTAHQRARWALPMPVLRVLYFFKLHSRNSRYLALVSLE
jgi:hypothetical protein